MEMLPICSADTYTYHIYGLKRAKGIHHSAAVILYYQYKSDKNSKQDFNIHATCTKNLF